MIMVKNDFMELTVIWSKTITIKCNKNDEKNDKKKTLFLYMYLQLGLDFVTHSFLSFLVTMK